MPRWLIPNTARVLLAMVGLLAMLLHVSAAAPARADDAQAPYVTLIGRAVLPADTFAPGPPSGFAITGDTNGRKVPFASQPIQGFSGVLRKWNGNYLMLVDNGFGAKANSADSRLRWYEVAPEFKTKGGGSGAVHIVGYTELSDPNHLVPWLIVNDQLDRVLTGADFDLESFRQVADTSFWYGDEFGPYLLHTDVTGKLLEPPIPTPYPAALAPFAKGLPYIQSPDNVAFVGLPTPDARRAAANQPSSKGFEGMALNTSGAKLYPLLEGPLVNDPIRTRLLIQEFDLATKRYTGKYWFYPMSDPGNAIGDMTAINDNQFLVIERDNNQGAPAKFKRIYMIDLRSVGADGMVAKELVADLMAITDHDGLTQPANGALGLGPIFTFPFVTIEDVYPVDSQTLLVVNDNNYPFSSGRRPGIAPDDNEFILLHLPSRLKLDL
jgi:hypothetical protein